MKTLVYELRSGKYELADFSDSGGEEVKFILEVPVDATLEIGEKSWQISRGVLKIKSSELPEGELCPRLFLGKRVEKLEHLFVKGGVIFPKPHDDEYIRKLGTLCERLSRRIAELEDELSEINIKINEPLEF